MDRRELMALLGLTGGSLILSPESSEAANHDPKAPAAKPTPVSGPFAHFCGIHVAKKDPRLQFITQHYCVAHSSGHDGEKLFQCILFDTTGPAAKLIGVEYIVSDAVYRKLPIEEKRYWHPHTYEVLSGGLVAPEMKSEDEAAFMKLILTTWGKTWHTWPDPTTAVPLGDPLLIWALTGDGQADPKTVATRDRELGVSTEAVRARRVRELGLAVPNVSQPASLDQIGRQWTDTGEDKPTRKE